MNSERELFEEWYLQHYYTRNGLNPDGDIFKKYHDGEDWTYLYDAVFRAWTVWQASAQRQGYKLVPVEPSDVIIDSLRESIWHGYGYQEIKEHYVSVYKAMIGAVDDYT